MSQFIANECRQLEGSLIALRRELHAVPENGGQLPLTKEIVCRKLDELNIPYHLNKGDDGIVAEIRGAQANHNPSFDVDEAVLWKGAAAISAIAFNYLR